MRVLGVDPGRKRIGLALSDEADGRIALPYATVERGGDDREAAAKVRQALAGTPVRVAVMGLPIRLNGTEGEAARRVRRFGEALEYALKIPVEYVDERMTTLMAERALGELGIRGAERKRVVDQAAAAVILQCYLEREASRSARALEEPWHDGDED